MDGSEVGSGAYGEVFFATLDGSEKVAVKQLRIVHVEAARIAMVRPPLDQSSATAHIFTSVLQESSRYGRK